MVNAIEEKDGKDNSTLLEMLQSCLTTRAFKFRQKHYELADGLATGSLMSPVVANIFMGRLEKYALKTFTPTPRGWFRFVNDVLTIIKRQAVHQFLYHLNGQDLSIKFTAEVESGCGELPLMDVTVKRKNSSLRTDV